MAFNSTTFRHVLLALFTYCLLSLHGALAAGKTAADYYVKSLPGAPEPLLRMYAGHIEIAAEHHANMFFWLYRSRHIANRHRLVIWLNGGPGCSSMDGALMEIGPYRVNKDGTLRLNDGSWDEFANVLFVDNPVGTGFSYVDGNAYTSELDVMASQMITFLEHFFTIFPEHAQDDIYIAGESYAGQHIPYIATAILDRNAATTINHWNLSGLLIGNGWISGPDQYPAYVKYAKANNLLQDGVVSTSLTSAQANCDRALENGAKDHVDNPTCEGILTQLLADLKEGENQCVNMYDVRLRDTFPECGMNWPPDLEQMTPYLRRTDVVNALNIDDDKKTGWTECNGAVGNAFRARTSVPSVKLLPKILETVPVILFSGDKDLICNHLGTEELINNLEWNGGKGMEISPDTWAPRRDWTFEGEPAGLYQEARNLTYIRFYNSSHMVPFDFPRRTRDMLDRFMGVDIASIGGKPADSLIDGEKAPSTSVGGHPNSTVAQEEEQDKLQKAAWSAYRRSAEVALFVLVIIVLVWLFFLFRDRRRRAGYKGLFGADPDNSHGRAPSMASGLGLNVSSSDRYKRQHGDLEAADFDEAELDDLTSPSKERPSHERYSDEQASRMPQPRLNGHVP